MVRNNRQVLRLFFILVISAAFMGWWYASTFWIIDSSFLSAGSSPGAEGDWVEFLASIAEQMLQLFLGLASPGS